MLDIVTYDNPVLLQNTEKIEKIDRKTVDFANDMLETMHIGRGIGLAAPQVGSLIRLFVCEAQGDKARIFINPEIIWTSQETVDYEEGCLSIPGVWADVNRSANITVQAFNEKGKPFRLDADGMLARVIQHEIDHLYGTLFIDHLTDRKREKILKLYHRKQKK